MNRFMHDVVCLFGFSLAAAQVVVGCGSSSSTTPAQDATTAASVAAEAAAYRAERKECRETAKTCQEAVDCIKRAAKRHDHEYSGFCNVVGERIGDDE